MSRQPPKIHIPGAHVTQVPKNSNTVPAAKPSTTLRAASPSSTSAATPASGLTDLASQPISTQSLLKLFEALKPGFLSMVEFNPQWEYICPYVDTNWKNHLASPAGQIQAGATLDDNRIEEVLEHLRHFASPLIATSILKLHNSTPEELQTYLQQTQPWACVLKEIERQSSPYYNVGDDHPVRLVWNLLPLLSIQRIIQTSDWLEVGRVLHNITNGDLEGLNMWIQFTLRISQPDRHKEICTQRYPQLRGSPLTVKTIAWYARTDNPTAYDQWHRAWCQQPLTAALTCLHADVAKAIYHVFWLEYICSHSEKNTWYKFNGTRLEKLDNAMDFRKDITNRFIPIYEEMRADATRRIWQELQGQDAQKKQLELLNAQISALIKKLKSESYKSTLIKAAHEFFHLKSFSQITDADPSKTGWGDCVIEICDGTAIPRPGKPEDFITMTTGISYRNELHWDHPLVKRLILWLGKVFVDSELLEYFKKDVASFLYGRNSEKHFRVWTGDTDNSKSMIIKLCEHTLGEYIFNIPVSVFSAKPFSSSGPTPEIAQGKSCHVGVVSEPDTDEDFRNGPIKRMSGGDSYFARKLNEDGGKITASYKPILQCNRIPNIPNADRATMNRWLILPFLSTWVENPPATEEEQYRQRLFLKDTQFEKQIPELSPAFGWLMVKSYPSYAAEGLVRPKIIQEYIDRHWESRDPYIAFIKERISYAYKEDQTTRNLETSLNTNQVYSSFIQWYRDQHLGTTIPPKHRFHDEMCSKGRLGPPNAENQWLGIVLISQSQNDIDPNFQQFSSFNRMAVVPNPLASVDHQRNNSDPDTSTARLNSTLSAANLISHNSYYPASEREDDDTKTITSTTSVRTVNPEDLKNVDHWIMSQYILTDDPAVTTVDELYAEYCGSSDVKAMTARGFAKCMSNLYDNRKGRLGNKRGYKGFTLK
jgi:phage/plasmid-associated DNA primase